MVGAQSLQLSPLRKHTHGKEGQNSEPNRWNTSLKRCFGLLSSPYILPHTLF